MAIHVARPVAARFRYETDEKRVADRGGRDPAVVDGAKAHYGPMKPVFEYAIHAYSNRKL